MFSSPLLASLPLPYNLYPSPYILNSTYQSIKFINPFPSSLIKSFHFNQSFHLLHLVTYTDVPTGPEGDTVARGSRITASIETHLGWMRDLRGEKPPTRYSTPVPTGLTGSTVPSDTDPLDSPLKTEARGPVEDDSGADGIDESNESRPPHSNDSVLPEDEDEVKGRRGEETEEGGEEGQGEKVPSSSPSLSPSPSSSQHNGSASGVPIAHEPESSKEEVEKEGEEEVEKEVEKEEVKASNVESERKDDKKDEKQNPNENRFEDVKQDFSVPGGVRLALLPDFRSKILWLAALVDVDGVVVIVRDELHSRLKEIIDTASCLSKGSFLTPPLLSPSPSLMSSSPSAEGFCDSFCSLVVRGIRSAAAPLSGTK
jgi:hypothetical protein